MKISDKHKKLIPYVVGGTLGFILLGTAGYWMVRAVGSQSRPLTSRKHDLSPLGYFSRLSRALKEIQAEADRIHKSAAENERLRLENMNLKLSLEGFQYGCRAKDAKNHTGEFELKLSVETGAKVGRSLSSINYQAPTQLFPSQLYTLALAYVVAREDEKAAVILTLLTGQESSATYKTAKDFLLTGVAWYRLENPVLADYYFDEVLKIQESETSLQYQAQARLWKAIVAEKTQKKIKAQFWLKELVDHHPNSNEAKWVNLAEEKHEAAK